MKKLIEMPYGKEDVILVEVDVPDEVAEEEKRRVGIRDYFTKPEKAEKDFTVVSEMVIKCSKPIVEALEMLRKEKFQPQKATAEFGLTFTAKGSIYLVEAAGEASIKISLEWNSEDKA